MSSVVSSVVPSAAVPSDDARDGAAHARVLCEVLEGRVRPPGRHAPRDSRYARVREQPMTKGRGAAAPCAEQQGCWQAAPPRFVSRPPRFVSRRSRLWGGGPLGAVRRASQWASFGGGAFGGGGFGGGGFDMRPRVVLALSWAFRSVRRSVHFASPAGRARAQHGARSGAQYGAEPFAHGGESASDGEGCLMRVAIRGHQRSSACIKAHQRPSVVISVHQSPSAFIRGHQWSSVVISGHQWQSEVIRGHQNPTCTTPMLSVRSIRGRGNGAGCASN